MIINPREASYRPKTTPRHAAQGQRTLSRCAGEDFEQDVFVPATAAAVHGHAFLIFVLLEQR